MAEEVTMTTDVDVHHHAGKSFIHCRLAIIRINYDFPS